MKQHIVQSDEFTPKLSIITINLNHRDGLQRTIENILSQTFNDFEWIIIDGGSTDGSRELIEQYTDYISYWVSEPDSGIYNAMNKGIHASHGEYLLFMNSGDTLYDNRIIERVIPRLNGIDIYVGDAMTEYGVSTLDLSSPSKILSTLLKRGFPHQSIFYRGNVFQSAGNYREDLKACSDWMLNIRAIVFNNATVEKIPFVVSVFEPGGISTQKDIIADDIEKLVAENQNLSCIFGFYVKYFALIEKVRNNRLLRNFALWYAAKRKWV